MVPDMHRNPPHTDEQAVSYQLIPSLSATDRPSRGSEPRYEMSCLSRRSVTVVYASAFTTAIATPTDVAVDVTQKPNIHLINSVRSAEISDRKSPRNVTIS